MKRNSDDDEEEEIDTGPDPVEVAARTKVIKRIFKRSLAALEKNGAKEKKTRYIPCVNIYLSSQKG